MRLIDADALKVTVAKTMAKNIIYSINEGVDVLKMIDATPAIDAVHVVRCRDCVLWQRVGKHTGKCPFLIGEHQYTGDDHYCSCGERKEDNAAD